MAEPSSSQATLTEVLIEELKRWQSMHEDQIRKLLMELHNQCEHEIVAKVDDTINKVLGKYAAADRNIVVASASAQDTSATPSEKERNYDAGTFPSASKQQTGNQPILRADSDELIMEEIMESAEKDKNKSCDAEPESFAMDTIAEDGSQSKNISYDSSIPLNEDGGCRPYSPELSMLHTLQSQMTKMQTDLQHVQSHGLNDDNRLSTHLTGSVDTSSFANAQSVTPVSNIMKTEGDMWADAVPRQKVKRGALMRRQMTLLVRDGWQKKIVALVKDRRFDYVIASMIILSSIFIAIETDWAARNHHAETPMFLYVAEVIFTIFFSSELLIRVLAERSQFVYGKNMAWNFLDLVAVLTSLLELILTSVNLNLTIIRVIRILRLVRLIRIIRVVRFFSDLRVMVWGIMCSMGSLFWAILLLVTMMFVFVVCICQIVTFQLSDEMEANEDILDEEEIERLKWFFGHLLATMYSLFKAITSGDDWGQMADPLMKIAPALGVCFCFYITFAVLAVLNIITGIFVENAIKTKDHDTDMMVMEDSQRRQKQMDDARSAFIKIDTKGTGLLEVDDFDTLFTMPELTSFMNHFGLELDGVLTPKGLFTLLDFDESGAVDMDEFIFGITRLKGWARAIDVARIVHIQRAHGEHMKMVEQSMRKLTKTITSFQRRNMQHQSSAPLLEGATTTSLVPPQPPSKQYRATEPAGSATEPAGSAPVLSLPGLVP